MSDVAVRISVAATLLWLGRVGAISFLEAPLTIEGRTLTAMPPEWGRI